MPVIASILNVVFAHIVPKNQVISVFIALGKTR